MAVAGFTKGFGGHQLFHDKEWPAGVGRAGVEHLGGWSIIKAPSSKHQAPSSKEAPNLNPKPRPERCGGYRARRVEVWGSELLWSLELGI